MTVKPDSVGSVSQFREASSPSLGKAADLDIGSKEVGQLEQGTAAVAGTGPVEGAGIGPVEEAGIGPVEEAGTGPVEEVALAEEVGQKLVLIAEKTV